MQQAQRSGPDSRSGTSSDRTPAPPEAERGPWHAPVITRLSLDRTLFGTGTNNDSGTGTIGG